MFYAFRMQITITKTEDIKSVCIVHCATATKVYSHNETNRKKVVIKNEKWWLCLYVYFYANCCGLNYNITLIGIRHEKTQLNGSRQKRNAKKINSSLVNVLVVCLFTERRPIVFWMHRDKYLLTRWRSINPEDTWWSNGASRRCNISTLV